jgi:hypothetical protein
MSGSFRRTLLLVNLLVCACVTQRVPLMMEVSRAEERQGSPGDAVMMIPAVVAVGFTVCFMALLTVTALKILL